MKSYYQELQFETTPQGIDGCSKQIVDFMEGIDQPHKEAVRYALSVEEVLGKMLDSSSDGYELADTFIIRTGKRYFRHFIELDIKGTSNNVFIENRVEHSVLIDSFLKTLNVTPEYGYFENTNIYTYRIKKKKKNPFLVLAIALIAALALGMAGLFALPIGMREACSTNILAPLHDTFLNILGCIAGPMIFLSVAWGIYGIGDAATFKQIGGKLLRSYLAILFTVTAAATLVSIPFFKPHFAMAAGKGSALSEIFSMILAVFPSNIFSPFVEGNSLQIIFLGVIVGMALMFLGRRTKEIAVIVEQINYIVQFLIEIISALVPYFIFIVLVELLWSNNLKAVTSAGTFCLVFLACVSFVTIFIWLITAFICKADPIVLLKKGLPTLATGIATASSAACLGVNIVECEKELGIDQKIASFGLPVGMVAFKLSTSINYALMGLFFATTYGVDVSVTWIIVLVFTAGVLSIATPPIPGGAASAYAVLLLQMGIPTEALAIALACDVVVDFIATGTDQFMIPYVLLNQANRIGLVDREKLLKNNK